MTPNGCRWLYAHAGGLIEVRSWAVRRSARARRVRSRCWPERPAGSCSRTTSRSTATTARRRWPVRFERDEGGIVVRPVARHRRRPALPGRDASASIRGRAPSSSGSGGDELLFADGLSRRAALPRPWSPRRHRGGLAHHRRPDPWRRPPGTAGDLAAEIAAEQDRATAFWHGCDGPPHADPAGRRARGRRGAPARDPAVVRPRRADPLPRAARPGAVLGRRLGHARRVPGAGRAAPGARPVGAAARPAARASSRTRTPTATGRSGSCSSTASAASAPATRTATSCSGRCSRSRSTCSPPRTPRSSTRSCRSSIPAGDAGRSTRRSGRTSSARSASSPRA